MPTFENEFEVAAPVAMVDAFHRDVQALRQLTPAPLRIDMAEVPAEGARAEFTVWIGPVPMKWKARYEDVGPNGFTDVQESGPLAAWRHTHSWEALSPDRTRVSDHIVYHHRPGAAGLFSRVFMSQPGLRGLFAYRKWRTRKLLSG